MFKLFKKHKVLIIIGGPGSGKGTQSEFISNRFNLKAISMGDLLRESIRSGETEGLKAKTYMDRGNLVPNKIVFKMLKKRITKPDCKNGILLDGFPRSVNQANGLLKFCKVEAIVLLNVDKDILISRLALRRICDKCGFISSTQELKGKTKCICSGEFIQRSDETQEAIEQRLSIYNSETLPMLNMFKNYKNSKGKNVILTVDTGNKNSTKEQVFEMYENRLMELLSD